MATVNHDGSTAPVNTADKPAPITPAPETDAQTKEGAKEAAAREAALEKAQAQCNRLAVKIASDWARQDRAVKGWMVEMGGRVHSLLLSECAADKPYSVAVSDLRVRLLATTGEDKSADLTRCIRVYFASLVFGAEQFAKLPIRGQKEFGTLLDSVTDDASKATVYVLSPATADNAKRVFAVACGDVKDAPAGFGERTKEGTLQGEPIARMVAAVKAGKDPLAPPAAVKEGETAEQPPAGGQTGEGKGNGKEGKEENATGERPPAPAGPVKLDVKPAVAGGELVRMLAEHDAAEVVLHSAAKASEFTIKHAKAIIGGMIDAGRIKEVQAICNFALYELRIVSVCEKEKCDRQTAIGKMEAQDMRRAG